MTISLAIGYGLSYNASRKGNEDNPLLFCRAVGEYALGLMSNKVQRENQHARLLTELYEAERKAWDSLSRYKFMMFGYWAAMWVHLNRIGGFKQPSPFKYLVRAARESKKI
jgi:hypothetical protein